MMRVLIVDDMPFLRKQMRDALESVFDCTVEEAGDGAKAVAMAGEFKPDIILMDIEMAGMNGVEATRAIVGGGPGPKVIMVTGAKSASSVLESIKAGAVNYVRKPVDLDHLLKIISRTAVRSIASAPAARAITTRAAIPRFAPIYQ